MSRYSEIKHRTVEARAHPAKFTVTAPELQLFQRLHTRLGARTRVDAFVMMLRVLAIGLGVADGRNGAELAPTPSELALLRSLAMRVVRRFGLDGCTSEASDSVGSQGPGVPGKEEIR